MHLCKSMFHFPISCSYHLQQSSTFYLIQSCPGFFDFWGGVSSPSCWLIYVEMKICEEQTLFSFGILKHASGLKWFQDHFNSLIPDCTWNSFLPVVPFLFQSTDLPSMLHTRTLSHCELPLAWHILWQGNLQSQRKAYNLFHVHFLLEWRVGRRDGRSFVGRSIIHRLLYVHSSRGWS